MISERNTQQSDEESFYRVHFSKKLFVFTRFQNSLDIIIWLQVLQQKTVLL